MGKDQREVAPEEEIRERLRIAGVLPHARLAEMMGEKESGETSFYRYCRKNGLFQVPNQEFVMALANHLRGKRVMEVGAGNGMMANALRICGVEIVAMDDRSWQESDRGYNYDVEYLRIPGELERWNPETKKKLSENYDVILVCWMADDFMEKILELDPEEMVFVGDLKYHGKFGTGDIVRDIDGEWVGYKGRETVLLGGDIARYALCYMDELGQPLISEAVSIRKV